MAASEIQDRKSKREKRRAGKHRVTTYIDRDLLMWLKVTALKNRVGYQTLLNRMLRQGIDLESQKAEVPPVTRAEFMSLASVVKAIEGALVSHPAARHENPEPRAKVKSKAKAKKHRGARPTHISRRKKSRRS